MARSEWTEHGMVWDDVAGDDRTMDDEWTMLFVDDLEGGASYDVDVTAAVRDALENHEPRLGIRIVASDDNTGAFYFGSRERSRELSRLVVRWRTAASLGRPTDRPTFVPTWSPAKRDPEREFERERDLKRSRERERSRERGGDVEVDGAQHLDRARRRVGRRHR